MPSKLYVLLLCLSLSVWCVSVSAERPARCLEPHPKGYGLCEMLIFGYHFDVNTNQCVQWNEGGCGTKGGHSYRDKEECEKDCINIPL